MALHIIGAPAGEPAGAAGAAPDDEHNKARRRQQMMIGSKYALGDDLGRGSSGRVFKALNTENGDFAAVKEISLAGISDGRLQGIETEINMLRRLSHPRVVQYLECITDATTLFIVLEYVENGSLSDIVRKFGRLPEGLVIRYIAQVLEALEFLHGQGVMHRDIKGANILVTKDGHVKLADFGVARLADEHATKTQSVVGTPYWMAPEIIEMSAFTTASDVWSVGCTVLELLTGVPPYFELTQMSAMYHIVNDTHPPLPDGLSDELRSFLLACFDKDVRSRPTAQQLRQHTWLTSTKRSVLAVGGVSSSPGLPDFLTRTVDKETSWLSSNGSHRSISSLEGAEGAPADERGAAARAGRRHGTRSGRERLVDADATQRRLAAAAGTLAGAPAADHAVRIGTDAALFSPSAAAAAALAGTEPPLCGFLWKRGTSALGKLAYYKRYFYVKDGALCYCSGRSDSTILEKLEKRIPLTSISAVEVSAQQRFEFSMACDSRTFQFRARTLREMHVWVNTLQALRERHEGIIAASSTPRRRGSPAQSLSPVSGGEERPPPGAEAEQRSAVVAEQPLPPSLASFRLPRDFAAAGRRAGPVATPPPLVARPHAAPAYAAAR